MFRNLIVASVLALNSENFMDVGGIVGNTKNIRGFTKSKNRPFTKGKRQKSLKERANRRKAKRGKND